MSGNLFYQNPSSQSPSFQNLSSQNSNLYGQFSILDCENTDSFSISSVNINLKEHFILPVCLKSFSDPLIETFALLDSGVTSKFINKSLVSVNDFSLSSLDSPRKLKVVDRRSISSGDVTHSVSSDMLISKSH